MKHLALVPNEDRTEVPISLHRAVVESMLEHKNRQIELLLKENRLLREALAKHKVRF